MLSRSLPFLICFLLETARVLAGEGVPVWLMGNGFHTSIVLPARDVPYRREITGDPHADELVIGWGASADYRGPSTPWTVLEAIFPNYAALHVVPVRGPIMRRFPRTNVVLLWLKRASFLKLVDVVNRSFAFTPDHRRIYLGAGYFRDSRFYKSSERFYFPYVCNMWVAIKLNHAGMHFCLPGAVFSDTLIDQTRKRGTLLQRRSGRREGF